MKRLVVLSLIPLGMILVTALSAAQEDRSDKEKVEERAELREQLLQWAQQRILPQLSEWKKELDAGMKADDLARLNQLRSRAAELRGKVREHLQGLREAWKNEEKEGIIKHRTALSETRKAWLDILDELEPLAFDYRETLKQIGTKAKPVLQEWKKEGKEIVQQWAEEHEDQPSVKSLARLLKRGNLPGMGIGGSYLKRKRVARFMLWDGETIPASEEGSGELPDIR